VGVLTKCDQIESIYLHQSIVTYIYYSLYTSMNIQTKCSGIAVCCAVKNNHKSIAYSWTAFISDHFCYHIRSQYFTTTSCMSIVVIIVRGYFFLSFSVWIPFLKTATVIVSIPFCVMIHILWVIFNFSCHERDNNLSLQNWNSISSHFLVIGYCIWNVAIFQLRHEKCVQRYLIFIFHIY
jgi:hypothetical protein